MSNIQNGQGIFSNPLSQDRKVEGHADPQARCKSRSNPLLAKAVTVTVGGSASDGTYSTSITDDKGNTYTSSFVRGAAEANAAIAEALAAAENANLDLLNISTAVYTSGATYERIYKHAGYDYTEAESAPGSGTLASAVDQAAGGSNIPAGRGVIEHASVDGAASLATSVALIGVTARNIGSMTNRAAVGVAANENYVPGDVMDIVFDGFISVKNNGSAAAARGGAVYVVINTAGGQELGEFRSDDDSANSDVAAGLKWAEAVPAGAVGRVYVRV